MRVGSGMYLSFVISFFFFPFVYSLGAAGAVRWPVGCCGCRWLGIEIYIITANCLMAGVEPLPWPFGPHVAGYQIQDDAHTLTVLSLALLLAFQAYARGRLAF